MSSEHNLSPHQLFRLGLAEYGSKNPQNVDQLTDCEWDRFGVEDEGLLPDDDDDPDGVIVPDLSLSITPLQRMIIESHVDQIDDLDLNIDQYLRIVQLISRILQV